MSSAESMQSQTRSLKWWEVRQLEQQGCTSTDWNLVKINADTTLSHIRGVRFCGTVTIGRIMRLENAVLTDSILEDGVTVASVPGGITGATIRRGAVIENTARIQFEPEAPCGIGLKVDVLDESGSRPVTIYPGLSAQMAMLQARKPKWVQNHLNPLLDEHVESFKVRHEVGEESVIRDCGPLRNVFVDREVVVESAAWLANGSIINNAAPGKALSFVGPCVDAENFIFEDARISSGSIVRNCYVGQGAILDKGFTAHDSLFFANSTCENGEACAFLAGPYTVSMHKSSLLIGCVASFMNAGSATNQSNHMYKLGPVHWGVLERGVKTSSNSYLMLGANIGAFSLLMGSHKTHPDSTAFPFSYLFGDERGATVVVPAQMLRSCGLMRDEKKWPTRDRRLKRRLPLNDRIHFPVLSPLTVSRMIEAIPYIDMLLAREADDDRFLRFRGMKFSRASLERAKSLYTNAIFKYLDTIGFQPDAESAAQATQPVPDILTNPPGNHYTGEWIDLCGQIIPRKIIPRIKDASSIPQIEEILTETFNRFPDYEREWIKRTFGPEWHKSPEEIHRHATLFDEEVERDRSDYLAQLASEYNSLRL